MIALDQAAGRTVGYDELTNALLAGFAETWGIAFDRGALTEEEQREETRLLNEKYAHDRWTYAR
jgi:lipoate-protein ligase A